MQMWNELFMVELFSIDNNKKGDIKKILLDLKKLKMITCCFIL